ncbi:MAG: hypothetical protein LH614_06865 [Pyrinomonadaceae bacterium]|nr:hypothetical protein [Pyrinomonadaceae bacterium]
MKSGHNAADGSTLNATVVDKKGKFETAVLQICDYAIAQTGTGASYSAAKVENLGFTGFFVKCP